MIEYRNNITNELDKYLIDEFKIHNFTTYILKWNNGVNDIFSIRVPGRTRGCIYVDENMFIIKIRIDDDNINGKFACYKSGAKESIEKYIGTKIILEN